MSKKKHKGTHSKRAEEMAARRKAKKVYDPATAERPRRVFVRNGLYIFLTALCVMGSFAALVAFWASGWMKNIIGDILSLAVGVFGVMCIYDLGLLLTACLTFGSGMINAGKDEEGNLMLFHASSVVRLELRDKAGHVLPEGKTLYKNAYVTFVMESGRINQRYFARLTAKQYGQIRMAAEAERRFDLNS